LGCIHSLSRLVCISIAIGVCICWPVSAQTFNVNTTEDTLDNNPGNGLCADAKDQCSLRAAIMEANVTADSDVVILKKAIYQLITPGMDEDESSKGDLDIIYDLSIQGVSLEGTIIDGGKLDRIFHIMNGASVAISGLTIRNGFTNSLGGGVLVDASTLTVSKSSVLDNEVSRVWNKGSGGGIAISNYSNLNLIDSQIENNSAQGQGGGISVENDCKAVIDRTSVMGNEAMYGGGIQVLQDSDVLIKNSVFYNNHVAGGGGALVSFTNNNILKIINSTFSGNTSKSLGGAGIIGSPKYGEILNSTITNNQAVNGGGGLLVGGDLIIRNTIIAGNRDPHSPDCYGVPLNSRGYNLIGISDANACRVNAISTDLLGSFSEPLNPQLLPLADNGGLTLTHALWINSPAIDAGSTSTPGSGGNACELKDQRGTVRIGRGVCDIGAFEATGGGDVWISAVNAVDIEPNFELMQQVITVGNKGPHKASRLMLTITLPIGSEKITISGEDWSCVPNANTINCTRNALNAQSESELVMEFGLPTDNKEVITLASIDTVSDDPIAMNNQLKLKTLINKNPVITTQNIIHYKVDTDSVFIAPEATITDEDDDFLAGATIQFTKGYQLNRDTLFWPGNVGIMAQWQPEIATLKLTGEDTLNAYEQALREVVFESKVLSADYYNTRVIVITVSDHYDDSKPATLSVILDKSNKSGGASSSDENVLDGVNPYESEYTDSSIESPDKNLDNTNLEKELEDSGKWKDVLIKGKDSLVNKKNEVVISHQLKEETRWKSLDAMRDEAKWLIMRNEEPYAAFNGMTVGVGAVFFSGFISLYVRLGSLLGLLFSFPMWTPFDPLPILVVDIKEKRQREKEGRESQDKADDSEEYIEEMFKN